MGILIAFGLIIGGVWVIVYVIRHRNQWGTVGTAGTVDTDDQPRPWVDLTAADNRRAQEIAGGITTQEQLDSLGDDEATLQAGRPMPGEDGYTETRYVNATREWLVKRKAYYLAAARLDELEADPSGVGED